MKSNFKQERFISFTVPGFSPSWQGGHRGRSLRQLITRQPQPQNRQRWVLVLSCFSSYSVVWAMMSPTFRVSLFTSINVIKIIPYRPSQKLPNLGNPSLTQSRNMALGMKFGIFSPLEMWEALLALLPNSALLSGYPQHSLTWWYVSRTSMTNYDSLLVNDNDALHFPA